MASKREIYKESHLVCKCAAGEPLPADSRVSEILSGKGGND